MDLRSYIELKEAYVNMMRPQQEEIAEQVEAVEEILSEEQLEALAEVLSEEQLDEFIRWGGYGGGSSEDVRKAKEALNKRRAERAAAGAESQRQRNQQRNQQRSSSSGGNVFTRAQAELDKAKEKDRQREQQITDDARRVFGKKTTAEREAEDRSAGRASEVRTSDGTNVRYTRQSDGSTRRKGQMATLGGQQVRWNVDASGKGSWRNSKGETVTGGSSSSSSSSSSSGRGAKGSTQGSGNNGAASGGGSRPAGGGSRPAAGGSRPSGGSSGGGSRPSGGSSGGGSRPASSGSSSAPAAAKTAPAAPAKQTGDKAKDMATWAKANPKLAAAQKAREATRGTSATTNPLMKDMKSRMPAPKTSGGAAAAASKTAPKFNPNAPKVASTTSASSAGGAKAAASKTGPKFNPTASRIAMGGNKVTTKPSAGAKAALAAATGAKFNPNAPKIKLNNSVEMNEFDVIIEHLVEQGFPVEEALKLMVNMSEEKREQIIAERSREFTDMRDAQNAAGARGPELSHSVKKTTKPLSTSKTVGSSTDRGPEFRQPKPLSNSKTVGSSVDRGPEFRREEVEIEEGMHREADTGKVVDKAEIGKTYYPNMPKKKSSVALRKEKEAAEKKKQPTNKESFDSLAAAYESVFAPKEEISEEEVDRLRDKRQERGGVDGNKRYPGFASAHETKKFGSGKTAAQKEAEEKYGKGATAMDIVKANLEKKYGKGAVMGGKKKDKKD